VEGEVGRASQLIPRSRWAPKSKRDAGPRNDRGGYIVEIVLARRDRVNWPGRSWLMGALLPDGAFTVLNAANVALGLTGLLEVGLLLRLVHPVNLFLLVLRSFEPSVREP
jgi:hypothetical protein